MWRKHLLCALHRPYGCATSQAGENEPVLFLLVHLDITHSNSVHCSKQPRVERECIRLHFMHISGRSCQRQRCQESKQLIRTDDMAEAPKICIVTGRLGTWGAEGRDQLALRHSCIEANLVQFVVRASRLREAQAAVHGGAGTRTSVD